MAKDEKNIYKIKMNEEVGEVIIGEEAVAVIAGLAAMEI